MLISRYTKCLAQCMRKDLHEAKPIHTSMPSLSDTEPEWFEPRNKKKRMPQSLLERSQVLKWYQINPLLMKVENKCLQKSEGKLFSTLFLCFFFFNYFARVEVLGTHVPVCLWKSGLQDLVLPPCGCWGSNSDSLAWPVHWATVPVLSHMWGRQCKNNLGFRGRNLAYVHDTLKWGGAQACDPRQDFQFKAILS